MVSWSNDLCATVFAGSACLWMIGVRQSEVAHVRWLGFFAHATRSKVSITADLRSASERDDG